MRGIQASLIDGPGTLVDLGERCGGREKSPRRLHQSVKALERKKKTDREEILVGRRFIPEPSFIVETIDRYLSTLP